LHSAGKNENPKNNEKILGLLQYTYQEHPGTEDILKSKYVYTHTNITTLAMFVLDMI
jgi:hypothetical protein